MKNLVNLFLIMLLSSILFTSCSSDSNPVAADEPGNGEDEIVIKTPNYMKITKIILTQFPENKSNGDKWDYHVFLNSPTRRPDIYVDLGKSGNDAYVYRSDIREDAILENAYDTLVFQDPASSKDGSLPYSVPLNQNYVIKVWDDDGLSADDSMGSVNISAAEYYRDDNATHVYQTLSNGSITIQIEGRWIY